MWNLLDWICQHWLSYNKLSSNNNNNNNHHVSVIQVCVSELTTCRAHFVQHLFVILILTDTDVNSVLFVDQQQLADMLTSQTMIILALLSDNVLFVQNCITLTQMRTHQSLYINVILIQSQSVDFCQLCWLSETQYDTLFKMSSYVRTFQWVLQQLQVTWSHCSLLCTQQWCTHCHLRWWEQQQHWWEWVCC
jgi:hypothetical protein